MEHCQYCGFRTCNGKYFIVQGARGGLLGDCEGIVYPWTVERRDAELVGCHAVIWLLIKRRLACFYNFVRNVGKNA